MSKCDRCKEYVSELYSKLPIVTSRKEYIAQVIIEKVCKKCFDLEKMFSKLKGKEDD